VIIALPYVLFCAGCASFQRKLIYFPPVLDRATADQYGVSGNLQRWNNASGVPIGWKRIATVQPARGQVLVLHGNASAAVQCAHYAEVIQQVAPLDVFVVEYPGYADRPGTPSERTLEESADEAFRSLPTNGPVYLVGESLGTGVACWLAGKYPDKIAGVVLLAPYNSLTDVAQEHMPLLPVHLLLVDRFPASKYLHNYTGPIAVLVADGDQVVPEKFGRRLYDGYTGPKRLWQFPGGNHGTVMVQPPEIWKQILDFLQANPHPLGRN
jgi:pimeloyl-ACP methyl ester carboxylesterase